MFRLLRPRPSATEAPSELFVAVSRAMEEVQLYAKSHGGRIELVDVTPEGEVRIKLRGTCAFCPLADITVRRGVEQELLRQVPGVHSVKVV
jgi:Fe-S cluster biogenesis protein NfuA